MGDKGGPDDESKLLPEWFIPSNRDVICGWARQNHKHEGNKRFRDIVIQSVPSYTKAGTKVEKTRVIQTVVNKIRSDSPGGGFVKRDFYTGRWYEIGDDKARDKVGHAIRKAAEDIKKQKKAMSQSKKAKQASNKKKDAAAATTTKKPNDIPASTNTNTAVAAATPNDDEGYEGDAGEPSISSTTEAQSSKESRTQQQTTTSTSRLSTDLFGGTFHDTRLADDMNALPNSSAASASAFSAHYPLHSRTLADQMPLASLYQNHPFGPATHPFSSSVASRMNSDPQHQHTGQHHAGSTLQNPLFNISHHTNPAAYSHFFQPPQHGRAILDPFFAAGSAHQYSAHDPSLLMAALGRGGGGDNNHLAYHAQASTQHTTHRHSDPIDFQNSYIPQSSHHLLHPISGGGISASHNSPHHNTLQQQNGQEYVQLPNITNIDCNDNGPPGSGNDSIDQRSQTSGSPTFGAGKNGGEQ